MIETMINHIVGNIEHNLVHHHDSECHSCASLNTQWKYQTNHTIPYITRPRFS